MSLRNVRKLGDELLRKKSRKIEVIDDRILELLDDMAETMYSLDGVGLAAPQVGVLRRAVVVDIGDENGLHEFINPEIVEQSGEDVMTEGCLSVPGSIGEVKRPTYVKVRAFNRKGEEFELEAHDYFARAICHEVDHLDGTIFVDKAENIRPKEVQ
ncbi:MAG: peptide deformylase [Clostridia bacterium]|nr:peptide deformylase [Clostridia bacterium]